MHKMGDRKGRREGIEDALPVNYELQYNVSSEEK
jgi:hypothetical protein